MASSPINGTVPFLQSCGPFIGHILEYTQAARVESKLIFKGNIVVWDG
jgi:hypothetical protein